MLRHQSAGFTANGMSVWDVPDADVARVGAILDGFPDVSHAYERPRFPGWPYNVFGMIHAHTEDECRAVAARIAEAIGVDASRLPPPASCSPCASSIKPVCAIWDSAPPLAYPGARAGCRPPRLGAGYPPLRHFAHDCATELAGIRWAIPAGIPRRASKQAMGKK
jgi:hypothetical protein